MLSMLRIVPLPAAVLLAACQGGGIDGDATSNVHRLAEQGDTAPLLVAIGESGNVDERDVCYRTPLMFAAQFGRIDTVRQLLAAGANVNLHEKGYYTALMLAAGNGHSAVVRVLADAGAVIDEVELTQGFTALIWAAQQGHRDTVRLLLERGADATIRDERGRTARDWALIGGHPEVAALL